MESISVKVVNDNQKANRTSLCIELLSGHKIYFKGETEGQRVLLGLHADIISVDEFVMPQAESEEEDE